MANHTVTFQFEGGGETSISAAPGENLLALAQKANVPIDAPCSGNGNCGKCRVRLLSGGAQSEETRHITPEEFAAGWRLACGTAVRGDATFLVPDIASAYRGRMRVTDLSSGEELQIFEQTKAALARAGLDFSPGVALVPLALAQPSLDDQTPDCERVRRAVCAATGVTNARVPLSVLHTLPEALRRNGFSCAGVVRREADGSATLLSLRANTAHTPICGLCVDIGTTTVSALLVNLETGALLARASSGNGQIRYGADVIHRIVEQQKPDGKRLLRDAIVRETLLPICERLFAAANVTQDDVFSAVIAGNTTMLHLLLGVDANPLRTEPYVPAFFTLPPLPAGETGLPLHPEALLTLAQNVGSYVGGDITAGVLASCVWAEDTLSLFIDLGTNGELALGNRDFLLCCACSAGPAFEGGELSCGMRATDGAIEAFSLEATGCAPLLTVIGGGKPVGLCGSGMIDAIAALFSAGVLDARGAFVAGDPRVRFDDTGFGRYVLAEASESATGREIALTRADTDNFIRAKGAIFSAITTMLEQAGLSITDIGRVLVAGGIGSGINMRSAVTIGMLPDLPLSTYRYIGNSALTGTYAMLCSVDAARSVADIQNGMTYLELSAVPGYMDAFVAACFLPHTDASLFPSVSNKEARA